jgi:trans-aconitate 2-methyltransferase
MSWNPDIYFNSDGYRHRLRPAFDLIARIPLEAPRCIVDLGCGAGDVTRLVAQRWPQADLTGVDNATSMLDRAKLDLPDVRWQLCDIVSWKPHASYDLVFSNAALQWVGNHRDVLPRLFGCVKPGGMLAVQMPSNYAEPSHIAIRDTVDSRAWRTRLLPLLRDAPVHAASFYYRLLGPLTSKIEIWETEYLHVLSGPDPIVAWTRPTTLRPLLDALEEPERSSFEADYRERVGRAYQSEPDGSTLYPFRRLFLIAER